MREYLRGIFCSTGKFDGTSLLNKKALRANDAHSREDEDRRKRPRSVRECDAAHFFNFDTKKTRLLENLTQYFHRIFTNCF